MKERKFVVNILPALKWLYRKIAGKKNTEKN